MRTKIYITLLFFSCFNFCYSAEPDVDEVALTEFLERTSDSPDFLVAGILNDACLSFYDIYERPSLVPREFKDFYNFFGRKLGVVRAALDAKKDLIGPEQFCVLELLIAESGSALQLLMEKERRVEKLALSLNDSEKQKMSGYFEKEKSKRLPRAMQSYSYHLEQALFVSRFVAAQELLPDEVCCDEVGTVMFGELFLEPESQRMIFQVKSMLNTFKSYGLLKNTFGQIDPWSEW